MRITPDTNVAARSGGSMTGPARTLLKLVRASDQHVLILSLPMLDELRRVLAYPRMVVRHRMNAAEIDQFIDGLASAAVIVQASGEPASVLSDPDDDIVLHTAIEGRSEVICTLDRHFREPRVLAFCAAHNIRVLTDVELLRELRPS